jgi:hypothetical protein
VLGVGPVDRKRGDGLPALDARHAVAEAIHHTDEIPPRGEGQLRCFGMDAFAHHHVGEGDACGQDADAHLPGLELGAPFFDDLQFLGTAVARDDDALVLGGDRRGRFRDVGRELLHVHRSLPPEQVERAYARRGPEMGGRRSPFPGTGQGRRVGPPASVGRAVGTGQHDRVAVRVLQPHLPVIRTALPFRRIPVPRQDHVRPQLLRPLHGVLEVIDLEPEEHAVAAARIVGIADPPVVVGFLPAMELQHELAVVLQPLVVGTSVRAPAAEQPLIPAAGRLHLGGTDQRLGSHGRTSTLPRPAFFPSGFEDLQVRSVTMKSTTNPPPIVRGL